MNWTDFQTHVLPYVPGCPWLMAKDHIIKAAREFCAKTLILDVTFALTSIKNQESYALTVASGLELVKATMVEVDGNEYRVVNAFTGRALSRQGLYESAALDVAANTIKITPKPSQAGWPINVDAAAKPLVTAATCPDALIPYITDIAHGAIASLCLIPKQDWSSFDQAVARDKVFRDRISVIGHQATTGFGRKKRGSVVEFK